MQTGMINHCNISVKYTKIYNAIMTLQDTKAVCNMQSSDNVIPTYDICSVICIYFIA
jgi:hypothetical protein